MARKDILLKSPESIRLLQLARAKAIQDDQKLKATNEAVIYIALKAYLDGGIEDERVQTTTKHDTTSS